MQDSILNIPLPRLALALLPPLVVVWFQFRWSLGGGRSLYAIGRMVGQLLIIGYLLLFLFRSKEAWLILTVLAVMLVASAWIALHSLKSQKGFPFHASLLAIGLAGVATLALVTQGVLDLQPWHEPRYLIPLAGMIFANAMNSVSLAAERLQSELDHGIDFLAARRVALQAALIPLINSLMAVGLVSLPGMMTGQILSGVSPLIAVRYQIMVMGMIYGSAGMAAILFLWLVHKEGVTTPSTTARRAEDGADDGGG